MPSDTTAFWPVLLSFSSSSLALYIASPREIHFEQSPTRQIYGIDACPFVGVFCSFDSDVCHGRLQYFKFAEYLLLTAGTARRRSSRHGPPTTRPCVSRSARLALVADQAED